MLSNLPRALAPFIATRRISHFSTPSLPTAYHSNKDTLSKSTHDHRLRNKTRALEQQDRITRLPHVGGGHNTLVERRTLPLNGIGLLLIVWILRNGARDTSGTRTNPLLHAFLHLPVSDAPSALRGLNPHELLQRLTAKRDDGIRHTVEAEIEFELHELRLSGWVAQLSELALAMLPAFALKAKAALLVLLQRSFGAGPVLRVQWPGRCNLVVWEVQMSSAKSGDETLDVRGVKGENQVDRRLSRTADELNSLRCTVERRCATDDVHLRAVPVLAMLYSR